MRGFDPLGFSSNKLCGCFGESTEKKTKETGKEEERWYTKAIN